MSRGLSQNVGTPFELPGTQNVSGVLSKDSIGLAGVTVDGVVFGEARAMWNKWMAVLPQDGVLGLGLQGVAPKGVRPLLDIMADQGAISARVFGLWLGRDRAGGTGELTLGGLNERLYGGDVAWVSLPPDPQWWAVGADNITLDGHPELDLCAGEYCAVMPVASTPYFLTSMAKAEAINGALGGKDIGEPGAAGLDCTTLYQLPNLKIEVGGRTMEMSPLEYTFQIRLDKGVQVCVSGFIGIPELDGNTLLLGTMFMQKYYTAFDRENGRLDSPTVCKSEPYESLIIGINHERSEARCSYGFSPC